MKKLLCTIILVTMCIFAINVRANTFTYDLQARTYYDDEPVPDSPELYHKLIGTLTYDDQQALWTDFSISHIPLIGLPTNFTSDNAFANTSGPFTLHVVDPGHSTEMIMFFEPIAGIGSEMFVTGGVFINPQFAFISFGQLTLQPVPIPAAVWLMGSGLLGLVGYSRKRYQVAA